MRSIDNWRPPFMAARPKYVEVGDVVAWDFRAAEVTHISERAEPDKNGRDMRATLHRLHGPKFERENDRGDMAVSFNSRWRPEVYKGGRVWLCSCCGDPAPCRITLAEEESVSAAREFEERLNRMGPGICYGCGEVITKRQERMTFPGEHADFPGRSGPTFHTRKACRGERHAYAKRAGLHHDGGPLVPPCDGQFIRHGDGTFECSGKDCAGIRAQHRMFAACYAAGCQDAACLGRSFGCTPDGTEVRR